jgi:hypothetical protein
MNDHTRRVAFTGAAVLLLALALLLNRRGSDPADRQRAHTPSSPVVERSPTPPTPSRTVQPPAVPARRTAHREREPRLAPAVAPGSGRAAANAARVFLHAYLAYSYGRAGADRIRGAAPPLTRALRDLRGPALRTAHAAIRPPRRSSRPAAGARTARNSCELGPAGPWCGGSRPPMSGRTVCSRSPGRARVLGHRHTTSQGGPAC